jgi:membrane protease YdiL (CAAX protease family)
MMPATLFGLIVALAGPAVPIDRWLRPSGRQTRHLANQAYLLALVGVILLVLLAENRPLASVGWQGIGIGSLISGLVLAAVLMWVVHPFIMVVLRVLRLTGFSQGLARLADLPPWSLVLAAIVAGIAEETLYRGFALTRLAEWGGSTALAAFFTTLVFAAVHQRLWGWGAAVGFVISGGVLAAFFVWQGDLLANIIAHGLTDAVGLLRLRRPPTAGPAPTRP